MHLNHISNQVSGAADYIWRKVTLISGVQLLSGDALLYFDNDVDNIIIS